MGVLQEDYGTSRVNVPYVRKGLLSPVSVASTAFMTFEGYAGACGRVLNLSRRFRAAVG